MKPQYRQIWNLAVPYLKQGVVKDLILHTKGVIKGLELLLRIEKGDEYLLMPAAILHDVGWSQVPAELQKSQDKEEQRKALNLHLEYAPQIIQEILGGLGYNPTRIKRITDIVSDHKFKDPKDFNKRLLIDADTLSDAFKEQFYSDAKSYGRTPVELYEIREMNRFYTDTARSLFDTAMRERMREIKTAKHK